MKVVITRSNTEIEKRERTTTNKYFIVIKDGKRRAQIMQHKLLLKKGGCTFKIKSIPFKDGSCMKVDIKHGLHNHVLPDRFERHAFVGCLSVDERKHVVDFSKRHVPLIQILTS